MSLFVRSWKFYVTLVVGALIGFGLYKGIVSWKRQAIARKMYEHLKNKLRYDPIIEISKQQNELQQFGKMDNDLWRLVDAERVKEGEIGYFEDDNLYWRKL